MARPSRSGACWSRPTTWTRCARGRSSAGRSPTPTAGRGPRGRRLRAFLEGPAQRRRSIAGRTLSLNGGLFSIVGVLPEGFQGPGGLYEPDLWLPLDRLDVKRTLVKTHLRGFRLQAEGSSPRPRTPEPPNPRTRDPTVSPVTGQSLRRAALRSALRRRWRSRRGRWRRAADRAGASRWRSRRSPVGSGWRRGDRSNAR